MSEGKTIAARTKAKAKPVSKAKPAAKNTLVIVESPAKAKTIEKYLGSRYTVLASMGHLIDLPKSRVENATFTETQRHLGLHTIIFEGRPDVVLADKLVLMRYRHKSETDWKLVPFEFDNSATAWRPGAPAARRPRSDRRGR